MLTVQKNKVKLTKEQYRLFRELTHNAKSLYNVYTYEIKQHYRETGQFLNYNEAYKLLKNHHNYKILTTCVAQQIMRTVEANWKGYFTLKQLQKEGKYNKPVREPGFLPKDGHFVCVFPYSKRKKKIFGFHVPKQSKQNYSFKKFTIPLPPNIRNKTLKQVRIVPKINGTYFELEYVYQIQQQINNFDPDNVLAIDTGVSNFAACLDNSGRSFILDGRNMKSINRFYNKQKAYLQTILKKQNLKKSKRIKIIGYKNTRRLREYLHQYVNFIVKYCLYNKISRIIVGKGHLAQDGCNIGDKNNQNFTILPFGKFCNNLEHKCKQYEIIFQMQDEYYTSKCDHLAYEEMQHHEKYLGKRSPRGLFKSSTGKVINADINGALGIMIRAGKGNGLVARLNSGGITSPRRISLKNIQETSSEWLIRNIQPKSLKGDL